MTLEVAGQSDVVRMTHDASGGEQYATRDAYRSTWYAKGWRSTDDPGYVGVDDDGPTYPPVVVDLDASPLTQGRYLGHKATAGAPTTGGPYMVGDCLTDAMGAVWVCTIAGSPGDWSSPVSADPIDGLASVAVVDTGTIEIVGAGTDVSPLAASLKAASVAAEHVTDEIATTADLEAALLAEITRADGAYAGKTGAALMALLTGAGYVFSRELVTPADLAAFSPTSTTLTDVTGSTISVTAGTLPVYPWLRAHVQLGIGTAAAGSRAAMWIALVEDGVEVDRSLIAVALPTTTTVIIPLLLQWRRTPAPGAHTYKLQMALVASGTYNGSLIRETGSGADTTIRFGCREGAA